MISVYIVFKDAQCGIHVAKFAQEKRTPVCNYSFSFNATPTKEMETISKY